MPLINPPPQERLNQALALLRDANGHVTPSFNYAVYSAVTALGELAGLPAQAKELTELLKPRVPHAQPTKPYNWGMHEID